MKLSLLKPTDTTMEVCCIFEGVSGGDVVAALKPLTRVEVNDNRFPVGAVCLDGMLAVLFDNGQKFCFLSDPFCDCNNLPYTCAADEAARQQQEAQERADLEARVKAQEASYLAMTTEQRAAFDDARYQEYCDSEMIDFEYPSELRWERAIARAITAQVNAEDAAQSEK